MTPPLTTEDVVPDLMWDLRRRNVALWLGAAWRMPEDAVARTFLVEQEWLGIWSESTDRAIAAAVNAEASLKARETMVVEVLGHTEAALGEVYSFAKVTPIFYLNGRGGEWTTLRRASKDDIRHGYFKALSRLGTSTLLVAGYADGAALAEAIERVLTHAPKLRIKVTGLDDGETLRFVSALPLEFQPAVHVDKRSLTDVCRDILTRRDSSRMPDEPAIYTRHGPILLRPLLHTQPPIDQDFVVVTMQDIADRDPAESVAELLKELLRGDPVVWRAFAHDLDWDREGATVDHQAQKTRVRGPTARILAELEALSKDDAVAPVTHFRLPADAGSGLTTRLHRLAFDGARSGFPTLVHRHDRGRLNFDLLQSFLAATRHQVKLPVLLVFDAVASDMHTTDLLLDLPRRLAKAGLRAVVVVGEPNSDAKPAAKGRNALVRTERLAPLRAVLSSVEQESLTSWADGHSTIIDSGRTGALRDFIRAEYRDARPDQLELLPLLYFVLLDDLRDSAALGRHFISRVNDRIAQIESRRAASDADANLEESPAERLMAWARGRMPVHVPAKPDRHWAVLLTLSALGALRVAIPRVVLADITGLQTRELSEILGELEDLHLIDIDDVGESSGSSSHGDIGLAPAAYYSAPASVEMRHPIYGRMILEALAKSDATIRAWPVHPLTQALLSATIAATDTGVFAKYPLQLLHPVLAALTPDAVHVAFAEKLAVRFLRLQREYGEKQRENFVAFQWDEWKLLAESYANLSPLIMQQSDVLLHSRAMLYKTCDKRPDIDDARAQYHSSERDLLAAADFDEYRRKEPREFPLTSLGACYRGWAERERKDGELAEAKRIRENARTTLEDCLANNPNNAYAAYHLARYHIDECARTKDEDFGRHLGAAVELLQMEPESAFRATWELAKQEAIALLRGKEATRAISQLLSSGDRFGFALQALEVLGGVVPTDSFSVDVKRLDDAAAILEPAYADPGLKPSELANLVRYAVFSAHPTRSQNPQYARRYELILALAGTPYMRSPIWKYDRAMLAFQTGNYEDGEDWFADLRRTRQFFDVPQERAVRWSTGPDSTQHRLVYMTIIETPRPTDSHGKGRVADLRLRDPVQFNIRDFKSRGIKCVAGVSETCYILLRASGPLAVSRTVLAGAPAV